MSNLGITLTIIGIVSMIGAYLLYKNTPINHKDTV